MLGGADPDEVAEEGPQFSNKLALICSCLGCVVGTGNIWRFPRIVASNSEEEGMYMYLQPHFKPFLGSTVPQCVRQMY